MRANLEEKNHKFCDNYGCANKIAFFCTGCNYAEYCGRSCAEEDWVVKHKKECHSLKIGNDNDALDWDKRGLFQAVETALDWATEDPYETDRLLSIGNCIEDELLDNELFEPSEELKNRAISFIEAVKLGPDIHHEIYKSELGDGDEELIRLIEKEAEHHIHENEGNAHIGIELNYDQIAWHINRGIKCPSYVVEEALEYIGNSSASKRAARRRKRAATKKMRTEQRKAKRAATKEKRAEQRRRRTEQRRRRTEQRKAKRAATKEKRAEQRGRRTAVRKQRAAQRKEKKIKRKEQRDLKREENRIKREERKRQRQQRMKERKIVRDGRKEERKRKREERVEERKRKRDEATARKQEREEPVTFPGEGTDTAAVTFPGEESISFPGEEGEEVLYPEAGGGGGGVVGGVGGFKEFAKRGEENLAEKSEELRRFREMSPEEDIEIESKFTFY